MDEINHHLNEFSCKNIAFGECLVKTGVLSTDLIVVDGDQFVGLTDHTSVIKALKA